MIGAILLGIAFIIGGLFHLRLFYLYQNGIKMKGEIIQSKYRRAGIRRKSDMVDITYNYVINGKEYSKTEVREKKKHLFKLHSMTGEPIQIRVQKKHNNRATLKLPKEYLNVFILLLILGIIAIIIGIISN